MAHRVRVLVQDFELFNLDDEESTLWISISSYYFLFLRHKFLSSALRPNSINVYFRLSVLFNDAVNREGYRVTFDIWINEYGTLVEWYWQGKNQNTREKISPTATLSTTNPTYIDLGTNPNRRGKRSATNRRRLHNKLSVHFLDILYITGLETLLSRNR